eukprot:64063-Prorocentrum_minimum.AAC.1
MGSGKESAQAHKDGVRRGQTGVDSSTASIPRGVVVRVLEARIAISPAYSPVAPELGCNDIASKPVISHSWSASAHIIAIRHTSAARHDSNLAAPLVLFSVVACVVKQHRRAPVVFPAAPTVFQQSRRRLYAFV